jgi:hypothetical protein
MGTITPVCRDVSSKRQHRIAHAVLGALGVVGISLPGYAFEFDSTSDVKVRWDNTFKYSTSYRLHDPSNKLVNGDPVAPGLPPFALPGPQVDDGDRNFKKGTVSNRVDWFSELDVTYKNVGMRISGSAWYDDVYNHGNDNKSQATVSTYSVPAGQFTSATERLMGRKAEILDAFVFLKSDDSSETPFNIRAGKHAVLYGESLFFGANGIANAQAPLDLIKLLQVPGSQFKEIIRPVAQISTQVQLTPKVSMGAYYQVRWEKNRIPAAGSFLSDGDFAGDGSELLFPGTPITMRHAQDLKAENSGQGGIQVRFKPTDADVEYGLYAAQYHDKGPQFMVDPVNGLYRAVYAEKVKTYGASFSTVLGESNVSGEASIRTNAPLVSGPQVDVGLLGNGSSRPLYAVGRTAHLQASMITLMGKGPLWDGASLLGEAAWNRRLSIQKNAAALDPNVSRDAMAIRFIFEPQYFQVVSGVDLSVPIGVGYNLFGLSSSVFKFNGGVEKGGDFSIGLTADYQKKIKAGVNFVHYFGPENAFLTSNSIDPARGLLMLTGAQSLHDRDFISFSVQTTF